MMSTSQAFIDTAASLPAKPRTLDSAATFGALVDWVRDLIREKDAPGFIVGISGTDSILAWLACARAFAELGEADRVLGIHYGPVWPPAQSELDKLRTLLKRPELADERLAQLMVKGQFAWIARDVMPWLAQAVPDAKIEVDSNIDFDNDYVRWANLFMRSIKDPSNKRALLAEDKSQYWVIDTRNATEEALCTYSNFTKAASLQPLIDLWKSEVLQICRYLGVPDIAVSKSEEADCECGRFDLAAKHIAEIDAILMIRKGLLSPRYLDDLNPTLKGRLEAFVDAQWKTAGFKTSIPYKPDRGQVIRLMPGA